MESMGKNVDIHESVHHMSPNGREGERERERETVVQYWHTVETLRVLSEKCIEFLDTF